MLRIVECTRDVGNKIPTIWHHLVESFGDKGNDIIIYAVLLNGKMNFVARNGSEYRYFRLDDNGYQQTQFILDSNTGKFSLNKDNYGIFYDGEYKFIKNYDTGNDPEIGIMIQLERLSEKDRDGYDGSVVFSQYNGEEDTSCQIHFQQMMNSKKRIYPFHLKNPSLIFVDEDYEKRKYDDTGLVYGKSYYYYRDAFIKGERAYEITKARDYIKSYGIRKFLKFGSSLIYANKIIRYVRIRYITKNGTYGDLFPLEDTLSYEEMRSFVVKHGFSFEIPEIVLNVYNGNDDLVNEIREICEEIVRIQKEKDDTRYMVLRFVSDNKD